MENNVVIYQSNDGLVKMEAIVDASNETIWATQKAMAQLFGIDLSGVSKHISNIYDIGELERDTTLAKFATLVQSGFRGTISKGIEYYNLEVRIAFDFVRDHIVKIEDANDDVSMMTEMMADYYVTSFSLLRDSLPMWHRYSRTILRYLCQ